MNDLQSLTKLAGRLSEKLITSSSSLRDCPYLNQETIQAWEAYLGHEYYTENKDISDQMHAEPWMQRYPPVLFLKELPD
jgi:hypothetical protein